MAYTVRTNNVPRDILSGWELTTAEREELDYHDWTRPDDYVSMFFRYRGEIYDLTQFERSVGELRSVGWDGWQPDSYFSGLVVRYVHDGLDDMRIVVGSFFYSESECAA